MATKKSGKQAKKSLKSVKQKPIPWADAVIVGTDEAFLSGTEAA
jgi:hypothetical protein